MSPMRHDEKEFMKRFMGQLSFNESRGSGITLRQRDMSFLREILINRFGVEDSPAMIRRHDVV